MDTFYAKCIPIVTSCVMAELEKLGPRYRIALRIARDERWERYRQSHPEFSFKCKLEFWLTLWVYSGCNAITRAPMQMTVSWIE